MSEYGVDDRFAEIVACCFSEQDALIYRGVLEGRMGG